MSDWTRFAERMPNEDNEIPIWETWPDAGIGVVLGKLSNLTCLDKDYDIPNGGNDALHAIIPYSPVTKKGEKGWTRFYQYNGEQSCSFDVGGMRVLDVLSGGRQTVVPPTMHPSGCSYVWITEESLDSVLTSSLPVLPKDFTQQVERVLRPYQTETDVKHQNKHSTLLDNSHRIDTDLSITAQYFREINSVALTRLDDWVKKLIPTARLGSDGWRCIATWRNAQNPNVGIHPKGIFDFGGNYPMTAIDLVMYANGLSFQKAAESLRACLSFNEDPIIMTVGGQPATTTPAPSIIVPPSLFPWQKPASIVEAPAPVMLPPATSVDPAPAMPNFLANPPGILGDISRWITATAPKAQPELALAAAISLCSVAMGRMYRSQFGNFTSLFIIMVAKSTEGKEHPQGCVEKALSAADLSHLIGGSGYTSAGAVYSALLRSPAHLATIDEMGKLLKISRAKGNAHAEAAIDKLVEAFGRQDGVLRPPTYSTMTLRAGTTVADRVVHNPAITLLGATTPGTFYESLTTDLVKDGFLGRCLVVESQQPRQLTRFVDRTDPPARVIDWLKAVQAGLGGNLSGVQIPDQPAATVLLEFGDDTNALREAFELELNDMKEASEAEGLDVLLGRTLEKSMKLAMIVAKAKDVNAHTITAADMEWAIQYVRHYDTAMVRAVRANRSESETDASIKRVVEVIRNASKYKDAAYAQALAAGGMPHGKLLKIMKMNSRQFRELMDTAVESQVVNKSPGVPFGCAGDVYFIPAGS